MKTCIHCKKFTHHHDGWYTFGWCVLKNDKTREENTCPSYEEDTEYIERVARLINERDKD